MKSTMLCPSPDPLCLQIIFSSKILKSFTCFFVLFISIFKWTFFYYCFLSTLVVDLINSWKGVDLALLCSWSLPAPLFVQFNTRSVSSCSQDRDDEGTNWDLTDVNLFTWFTSPGHHWFRHAIIIHKWTRAFTLITFSLQFLVFTPFLFALHS